MDTIKLSQLLPDFYKKYNLPPDGGIDDPLVKVELTKNWHLFIPNFEARKKALLKHDIHHLVTGYPSELKGESEISAWEIASGCSNYWAALLLDSQGFLLGIFLYPKATFAAFKKGRRTTNLYQDTFTDQEILNLSPRMLKRRLKLTEYPENQPTTFSDVFSFLTWFFICSIIGIFSLVLLPVILFYNLKYLYGKRARGKNGQNTKSLD